MNPDRFNVNSVPAVSNDALILAGDASRRLRLFARAHDVPTLDSKLREQMWLVFREYYADVTRELFLRDLQPKNRVIVLCDRAEGQVQGFSTLQTYHLTVTGRKIAVFYSGDTIIRKEFWGQTALQRAWLAEAMRFKLQNPITDSYWFLVSKGYKTYLLLSRNFVEYWPRHDRKTPPHAEQIIDAVSGEKFQESYCPQKGILRHNDSLGKLREEVAPIGPEQLRHADIRFFAERNPGHQAGEELCCIGKIHLGLATHYLGRLVAKALS